MMEPEKQVDSSKFRLNQLWHNNVKSLFTDVRKKVLTITFDYLTCKQKWKGRGVIILCEIRLKPGDGPHLYLIIS